MPQPINVSGLSDVGQIRRRNEDSFAVFPDLGVAVVADGMGGHPGGDVASRIAADEAGRLLAEAVDAFAASAPADDNGAAAFIAHFRPSMTGAVLGAHQAVRREAGERPELDGMGTTLTAMVLSPASGAWIIGHVGDSRAYRLRDGALTQLTRDDTWIQDQIEQGVMRPESAKLSPYAHLLTQCVGLEDSPTPQILDGEAVCGDQYLLCTDGLVGMVDDVRVAEVLESDAPLEALIAEANEAGGQDNITATLVRYG